MIDLTNYKIILYHYPYTTKELEKMIWDKMDTVDSRWAVKLTIGGVNDSGEYDDTSWDLFFLEPKLEEKIDLMLDKYETQYVKTDYTELLGQKREEFTEEFMFKLLDFLNYYYTIYKLCELLGQTQYLPYFPMLKDRDKRIEQDEIWKKICMELNWDFIPTQ